MEQRHYVGIDLHRRRSVIVRRSAEGETLETTRIDNDAMALAAELAKAGEHPDVVLEATYGWYWAADVLAECGANVHLAHPLGNYAEQAVMPKSTRRAWSGRAEFGITTELRGRPAPCRVGCSGLSWCAAGWSVRGLAA